MRYLLVGVVLSALGCTGTSGECVSACGIRFDGNCAELREIESASVSLLAAGPFLNQDRELCQALGGYKLYLRDNLGPYACALTSVEIEVAASCGLRWSLPHEMVHIWQSKLDGVSDPTHSKWEDRGFTTAVDQLRIQLNAPYPN